MPRGDPRRIVADGYDRIAERYAEWTAHVDPDGPRARYTAQIVASLPEGASVLELGCGGGGPTTRMLAEPYALTGVDISARQIERARQHVPTATFMHADMTRLDLPLSGFDGVVALFSLTHLPYGELPGMLRKVGEWLRPGGLFLATMSSRPDRGAVETDWLGAPMYFSGYTVEENRQFVEAAGLEIESAVLETILEDGRPVTFLWVVATRQAAT